MQKVEGNKTERVYTLKTMYDQDSVAVLLDGEPYRLTADVITQLLKHFDFEVDAKKIHKYLVNPVLVTEELPAEFINDGNN